MYYPYEPDEEQRRFAEQEVAEYLARTGHYEVEKLFAERAGDGAAIDQPEFAALLEHIEGRAGPLLVIIANTGRITTCKPGELVNLVDAIGRRHCNVRTLRGRWTPEQPEGR